MRCFTLVCLVAAVCCAARAEASRPPCQHWEQMPVNVVTDVGSSSDGGGIGAVPLESADGGDGGITLAPPPIYWVCTKPGYQDEGGCSVAGGFPTAGVALAALALVTLRARRKVR